MPLAPLALLVLSCAPRPAPTPQSPPEQARQAPPAPRAAPPTLRVATGEGSDAVRLGSGHLRHEAGVRALAFSGNGKRLATIARDGQVYLWDPATGALLGKGQVEAGRIALDEEGKLLATGRARGPVELWRTDTWARVRQVRGPGGHDDPAPTLAFSPGGSVLAVGFPGKVELWDHRKPKLRRTLKAGPGVRFLPGGRLVALQLPRSDEHRGIEWSGVRVYDWRTGRRKLDRPGEAWDHSDLAFGPGAKWVALARADGASYGAPDAVRVVAWPSGKALAVLKDARPEVMAMAPGADLLATSDGGHAVRLWRLPAGEPVLGHGGHTAAVSAAFLAAAGQRVITSAGPSLLWNTRTGALLGRVDRPAIAALSRPRNLLALCQRRANRRQPFNMLLVSAGTFGPVWERQGRCVHWAVASKDRWVHSPGCRIFAAGAGVKPRKLFDDNCDSKVAALWISEGGEQVQAVLSTRPRHGRQPSWSKPKPWWTTGRLRLLRRAVAAATNELVDLPGELPLEVRAMAFSAGGELLALGDVRGEVRLRRATTGKVAHALAGHTGAVIALAFACDGSTLFTAAADSTLRLWDTRSGQEVQRIDVPSVVTALDISSSTAALVTGHRDTTAKIWRLKTKPAKTEPGGP